MSPLCSRNARSQKTLVGRAQWGTHPGHPGDNEHEQAWKYHPWLLTAALPAERRVLARRGWAGEKSGLFEHPAKPHPNQCFEGNSRQTTALTPRQGRGAVWQDRPAAQTPWHP